MTTTLYRFFDESENLLYVGISSNHVRRMTDHKRSAEWFYRVKSAKFEHFQQRFDAEEAEKKAIQTEKPIFNIQHRNSNHYEGDVTSFRSKMHISQLWSGITLDKKPMLFDDDHNDLLKIMSEWGDCKNDYGFTMDEFFAFNLWSALLSKKSKPESFVCFDTCTWCSAVFDTEWFENEVDKAIQKVKIAKAKS